MIHQKTNSEQSESEDHETQSSNNSQEDFFGQQRVSNRKSSLEFHFPVKQSVLDMFTKIHKLRNLQENQVIHRADHCANKILILVSQDFELASLNTVFSLRLDESLTDSLHSLGQIFQQKLSDKCDLFVAKTSFVEKFGVHGQGYTHMGALAALAAHIINPDLVILYGCCGSLNSQILPIGTVCLSDSGFHLDRFRTKDQDSFEWGFWAGQSMKTPQMLQALQLKYCHMGTTVGVNTNSFQDNILDCFDIQCIDLELACVVELMNQTGHNFIGFKFVSHVIDNQNMIEQEKQFFDFTKRDLTEQAQKLRQMIEFFQDRQLKHY